MRRINVHANCPKRERRDYERWKPKGAPSVLVSGLGYRWSGLVLNLSDGGSEVLGLPPSGTLLGTPVEIILRFGDRVVMRDGVLLNTRVHQKQNSHVLAFLDCDPPPERVETDFDLIMALWEDSDELY